MPRTIWKLPGADLCDEVRRYLADFAQPEPDPFCDNQLTCNTTNLDELWKSIAGEFRFGRQMGAVPYWGIVWPGSRALARFIIDHAEYFQGRRVLDLATGSGTAAIAAARCGAQVTGVDVDPMAIELAEHMAELNGVQCDWFSGDAFSRGEGYYHKFDWVLAGDIFYDKDMAERGCRLLQRLAHRRIQNLVADPHRNYRPRKGFQVVTQMKVPVIPEIEGITMRDVTLLSIKSAV
ncbi:MAG: methyltransferase [Leptospiraceae bacterium]|nr:methyltransferase [Leptospiraceae bacterium]